jgi:hypothetical protein
LRVFEKGNDVGVECDELGFGFKRKLNVEKAFVEDEGSANRFSSKEPEDATAAKFAAAILRTIHDLPELA